MFEDVGAWKRAHLPRAGEDLHAAVIRECVAVRRSVGIFDASTLGKIEVVGPDAAEFLNRMYINSWTKLGVGRCRYGILCREDGFIRDDGVVGRIAPDRFHVTTTTGGAAGVLAMMEDYCRPNGLIWTSGSPRRPSNGPLSPCRGRSRATTGRPAGGGPRHLSGAMSPHERGGLQGGRRSGPIVSRVFQRRTWV